MRSGRVPRLGPRILLNSLELVEYGVDSLPGGAQARRQFIRPQVERGGFIRIIMGAINKPIGTSARPRAAQLGAGLLRCIGETPLLRLERMGAEFPHLEFYAKAEWFNPGGSVKDRAGYSMICAGERSGDLRAGKLILDATSGNTGIAY